MISEARHTLRIIIERVSYLSKTPSDGDRLFSWLNLLIDVLPLLYHLEKQGSAWLIRHGRFLQEKAHLILP